MNQARIDFRTTTEIKSLIEKAATLRGMTVSDFATTVLLEKSQEVLQSSETTILTNRDRDIFLYLLDNHPTPNDKLLKATSRFKKAVETGDLIV
jgi:uncharacterized protein (DUF1778 family)